MIPLNDSPPPTVWASPFHGSDLETRGESSQGIRKKSLGGVTSTRLSAALGIMGGKQVSSTLCAHISSLQSENCYHIVIYLTNKHLPCYFNHSFLKIKCFVPKSKRGTNFPRF